MATLSTESARFYNQQQAALAKLKVGQYSKFLSKNPIFVTYYAINQARSRTDAGTGNIQEYIGKNSPIRFNKITTLPVYNVPDMRPEVVSDEGGYSVEMELSDLTFLPGTVRPQPGDCIRFDIYGTKPLLYQCTTFRNNTIQSKDFYMGDYTLIDVDQDYLKSIEEQVVERYICNFESIGTNEKVFLTEDEDKQRRETMELIDQLCEFYQSAFYNKDVDGFILYKGNQFNTQWYYDNYLTHFINTSGIFTREDSDMTVILPFLDLTPLNFNMVFKRTIWNAVLEGKSDYLNEFTYAWNGTIHNRVSPLNQGPYPAITPFIELCTKYVKPQPEIPAELGDIVAIPGEFCGWTGADPNLRPYFSLELVKSILTAVESDELNAIEKIIYQYVAGGPQRVVYDKKEILNFAFRTDMFTFMHMPLIIYILQKTIKGGD